MNSLTQYFVMLLNLSRESFKSIKIFQLSRLFTPVDIASLVYFRIVFGAIMFWEVIRYFQYDGIKRYYLDPKFLFTYYGFEWIKPWPGDGMYYHFLALGVLSLFIILGLFYRVSALLFFPWVHLCIPVRSDTLSESFLFRKHCQLSNDLHPCPTRLLD